MNHLTIDRFQCPRNEIKKSSLPLLFLPLQDASRLFLPPSLRLAQGTLQGCASALYIIGPDSLTQKNEDDAEPAGTPAGVPMMLEVLSNNVAGTNRPPW